MDSIIDGIELTLEESTQARTERKEQIELENKEAETTGVKDRSAEGKWK